MDRLTPGAGAPSARSKIEVPPPPSVGKSLLTLRGDELGKEVRHC